MIRVALTDPISSILKVAVQEARKRKRLEQDPQLDRGTECRANKIQIRRWGSTILFPMFRCNDNCLFDPPIKYRQSHGWGTCAFDTSRQATTFPGFCAVVMYYSPILLTASHYIILNLEGSSFLGGVDRGE